MSKDSQFTRAMFTTKIGAIATTVGSAVGLGNIWRFPFEAGSHGGSAFIICYIFFILVIGVPVMLSEFVMGRASRSNIFGAFNKLSGGKSSWSLIGMVGIIACFMILSFYSVVAGWTVEYCWQSAIGALDFNNQQEYHDYFNDFSGGNWRPLIWTWIFLAINLFILLRGVAKGIEKMSNVLMPIMFVLLVVFGINSLSLDKANEGLSFMFKPDFSQLTSKVILSAMGQAFFSLSLGLGTMMTYASYFKEDTNLGNSALSTAGLDTLVAVMSGVIIFPAVFTFGVSPTAGPTLVFEVLPSIFHRLPGGMIWSTLFFFMLFLASVTSTISMAENPIAYFTEERHMSRKKAVLITILVSVIFATLCTLSFGCLSGWTICGMTIFSLFDYISSNILLPVGGLVISLFVGWKLDRKILIDQLTNNHTAKFYCLSVVIFCLKWVAPAGIMLVFLNSIGII